MDYKDMDEEERKYRDKELPSELPTPEQCAIMELEQEVVEIKRSLESAHNNCRSNSMAIFEMQGAEEMLKLREILEGLREAHLRLQDHMLGMYKVIAGK